LRRGNEKTLIQDDQQILAVVVGVVVVGGGGGGGGGGGAMLYMEGMILHSDHTRRSRMQQAPVQRNAVVESLPNKSCRDLCLLLLLELLCGKSVKYK
jgi:hypothetical protein